MASLAADEFGVCQCCSSVYKDPRTLPCLHSYCLRCIEKISIESSNSVTCPSCNELSPLPKGGVVNFPSNIRLTEEIKTNNILTKVLSSPSPVCTSCEDDDSSGSPSVAYCRDCEDFLCNECWKAHLKTRVTRLHTMFNLEDLKAKERVELLKLIPNPDSLIARCPTHNDEQLRFYCMKCTVPVCVQCVIEKHKDHSVQELRKRTTAKKLEVLNSTKRLYKQKQTVDSTITKVEETKKEIKTRKREMEATITQTFSELRQLIDQQEKALLADVNILTTAKETRLSIQLERLQKLVQSISHCHSLALNASEDYTDIQFLSIADTLDSRVASLEQLCTPATMDVCETPEIILETSTDGMLAEEIASFITVVDPSQASRNVKAIIPRYQVGIRSEMKVTVTTDSNKKQKRIVRANLVRDSSTKLQCPISDNDDGTYTVSVIPQQLGQHQLSITVNGLHIQESPFNIAVLPQRDYTRFKNPVQTFADINSPTCIAFSSDGDMFVTSFSENVVHVYNAAGMKKFTFDSAELRGPYGIDVVGEVVYIAQYKGHQILKFTRNGEFLSSFGEKGSGIGQFSHPFDVKISPDDKLCVSDSGNHRIQVFNLDFTISHVIDGDKVGNLRCPFGMDFDLAGNLHVVWYEPSAVTIFSPTGCFMRQYGKTHVRTPIDVAIDSSGYAIVSNCNTSNLSIFSPDGKFIKSVGYDGPFGIAVSPDGSVSVAGIDDKRVLIYQ